MKLFQFIDRYKPLLRTKLEDYFSRRRAEPLDLAFYTDSLDRLETLAVSGKLLRGILILLIYSFSKDISDDDPVFHAAAAMECVQTALLIHDDIIDNDDIRRGMPSTHASYRQTAQEKGYDTPEIYGKNLAICAGDIALFLAFDLLSQSTSSARTLAEIVSLFARETQVVAVGEMLDVDLAYRKKEPSSQEIFEMYIYKTARYSFSLPFAAGAVLSSSSEETKTALHVLGKNIGVLFQMRDDWLGLYGNESQTGKPVGSDIRENKKTVYRSMLYEKLTPDERRGIDSLDGPEFLRLIQERDVESRIADVKHCYERESYDLIEKLPYTNDQKELLREIVHFVIHRDH